MVFGHYIVLYSHQETHNKWANQRAWIFEFPVELSSILPNYFLGRSSTIPSKHNYLYINSRSMQKASSTQEAYEKKVSKEQEAEMLLNWEDDMEGRSTSSTTTTWHTCLILITSFVILYQRIWTFH
jgi:hypothetical protein